MARTIDLLAQEIFLSRDIPVFTTHWVKGGPSDLGTKSLQKY